MRKKGLRIIINGAICVDKIIYAAPEMAGHDNKRVQVLSDETYPGTVHCCEEHSGEFLFAAVPRPF